MSVVILAAGQGKRMKSDLPKVLQPLAGRPLLKHVIDVAQSLEPADVHVVYGHGGERVREALRDEKVNWVLQAEQLGTGHALMQAMPHIAADRTVLVLYGDVPLIQQSTLTQLVELAGPRTVSLLTMMANDPNGYGRIVRNARGQVQKIVEQKDATKTQLKIRECNTGILAAPAKALKSWLSRIKNNNAQGEYYLTDIIALAVKDKVKVAALVSPTVAEVLGVNDKVQLAEVEALRRQQICRDLMLAGVTLADPARVDVRGTLRHGSDVFVDVNVVFEGTVVLGNRVRIGPNCVIRNAQIGDDTEVFASCVIDNANIGPRCQIGPFARFRPTSTLAEGVHIGNFVEVKNSSMGAGSKANHLSYVGDAQVGSRVNIGAGTIVANYDGANKHRTIIEDDVHTGSNSVLVAPITVGSGATIGAGSTVAKQVPPGKLTVARARQVTIEGWQRPKKQPKAS
ncbi:MAG: bifunctional UDP-N-acetylglucosamine diphosphorylase/glucosamine-1-phosphate N-acetyltransferase GlmU [Steroidobacteraceae bacterium]|nr:bifunctional UDP-N-acetylglucosamine diphosphorylase/glucosamine-1-phosphate N-acetyltransferase GlmU [Steroidobacteraceae bacterium]